MRSHPGMAKSCELFDIYEQARAAIAEVEATICGG
jgi:hypothetical protein